MHTRKGPVTSPEKGIEMDNKIILPKKQIISLIEQIQDCLKHEKEIPIPGSYADEFLKAANEYNRAIREVK